jgi:hypothetical protein
MIAAMHEASRRVSYGRKHQLLTSEVILLYEYNSMNKQINKNKNKEINNK